MSKIIPENQIVLELTGSRAIRGVGLFDLESFIDEFLRGLRAFDRSTRLERPLRSGHPTKREEYVTALRLVKLEAGSAVLTIEGAASEETDTEMFPDAGTLAFTNLNRMLGAIESDAVFDADVADALSKARRALGADGKIIVRGKGRRVVFDEAKEREVIERTHRQEARSMSISGRLHFIDLEPDRIGIRAADGIDWTCRYPEPLEDEVRRLLGETVWARGVGQVTGAQRGTLDIEELQSVGPYEQSELFSYERIPLSALAEAQGISGPTLADALTLPSDVTDEQLDGYLADILGD